MSVKLALLALLEQQPMHGYQLRAEFEQRTGATWPLNVGQVYQTLSRLQRDGLVAETGVDGPVDAAGQHRVIYRPTEAGRAEVTAWFASPVARSQPPRDELAIKLALAVTVPGVDVAAVIQRQRSATMAALQDYTRLKQSAGTADSAELAWSLVLDALVFDAEAEIRWLDHCEARVRRAGAERRTQLAPPAATPSDQTDRADETPETTPSTAARPGAGTAR